MEKYMIKGGRRLQGEVFISGAKNASAAILPAAVLSDEPVVIENVPNISDTDCAIKILMRLGADVKMINRSTLRIDPRRVTSHTVEYDLAKNMRSSYYFLGALLGKLGCADVSLPGGCDLGPRPIDQHIKGFHALNAVDTTEGGMVHLRTEHLSGGKVDFDVVTVGATINVMLAACKADGLTVLENAAKEPHVVDLANFLNSMGADIMGAGTDVIKIRGVERLHGTQYSIIPDQIEAGTFMVMAAATEGDVLIRGIIPKHLESITVKLQKIGVQVEEYDDSIRVIGGGRLQKANVKTMPHPGFPTDMQPQITTLLAMAEGTSIVTEGVSDSRFKYVNELRRMGADISVDGKVAVVQGIGRLKGAPVKADDLRAGAAMIIAGLAAEGVTEIENIHFIDRGYENIEKKLSALGADIRRVGAPEDTALQQAR
ncbi:MAG: UDP-N-acetylglucosamine 1-carboxyvinyltransferase [Oscillospiraceae bacterium]|nr:UDP-N-acetylglucosamine 1-carboxyvinyltransferase [Oscillospiraceae bacterium]